VSSDHDRRLQPHGRDAKRSLLGSVLDVLVAIGFRFELAETHWLRTPERRHARRFTSYKPGVWMIL
jgi:hypothetical protein